MSYSRRRFSNFLVNYLCNRFSSPCNRVIEITWSRSSRNTNICRIETNPQIIITRLIVTVFSVRGKWLLIFSMPIEARNHFRLRSIARTRSYERAWYWIIKTRKSCRRMYTTTQGYLHQSLIARTMGRWCLQTKASEWTSPGIYFGTFTTSFTAKLITCWSSSIFLWWHSQ